MENVADHRFDLKEMRPSKLKMLRRKMNQFDINFP